MHSGLYLFDDQKCLQKSLRFGGIFADSGGIFGIYKFWTVHTRLWPFLVGTSEDASDIKGFGLRANDRR